MLLFIPRSLCALKRIVAKTEHHSFAATQGIRIALAPGLFRAEACDGNRAMIVQGLIPTEEPPWPGFKEVPDDACEAIVFPKDLEKASKLGDEWTQRRFGMIGIATVGGEVYLGLGSDLISTRTVEGRFPRIERAIPTKRPLFSFRIDPMRLAETLLAISDLLPDHEQVQCFYYGEGVPLGFCARNSETGMMIDALVVPFVTPKDAPKPDANGQTAEKPDEQAPKAKGRGKKTAETPANDPTTPEPKPQDTNPAPEQQAVPQESNGQATEPESTSGNAQDGQEKASRKPKKKAKV